MGFLACSHTLNGHLTILLLYRRTETITPNWLIWKPSSRLSKKKSSSRLAHPIICRPSSDNSSVCFWTHSWSTVPRIPSWLLLFRPADSRMESCPHNPQRTGTAQVRHNEIRMPQLHSTCCMELVDLTPEPVPRFFASCPCRWLWACLAFLRCAPFDHTFKQIRPSRKAAVRVVILPFLLRKVPTPRSVAFSASFSSVRSRQPDPLYWILYKYCPQ